MQIIRNRNFDNISTYKFEIKYNLFLFKKYQIGACLNKKKFHKI